MAHEEEVIANNNEIYSRHLLLFNAEGHWDCDSEEGSAQLYLRL